MYFFFNSPKIILTILSVTIIRRIIFLFVSKLNIVCMQIFFRGKVIKFYDITIFKLFFIKSLVTRNQFFVSNYINVLINITTLFLII